jgi:hypothetical protein
MIIYSSILGLGDYEWVRWDELTDEEKKVILVERALNGFDNSLHEQWHVKWVAVDYIK